MIKLVCNVDMMCGLASKGPQKLPKAAGLNHAVTTCSESRHIEHDDGRYRYSVYVVVNRDDRYVLVCRCLGDG